MSEEKKLRLGIVGCGMIAEHHLAAIKLCKSPVTVTAAIDPNETRRNVISELTGAAAFASLDEALAAAPDSMDAIAVMLPHDLHEQYSKQVLAAGKHLFLEKPVARDAAESQRIFDAADAAFKSSGARFFMAENSSFWPEVHRAKQLIKDGAIGEVVTARSHYYESLDDTPMNPQGDESDQANDVAESVSAPAEKKQRTDAAAAAAEVQGVGDSSGGGGGGGSSSAEGAKSKYERADTGWLGWRSSMERAGGGVVLDGGQHWIRPLREFMREEVESVVAITGRPLPVLEGESMAHAILEFASGKHASFQATVLGSGSAMSTKEPCFRVIGTKGEVVIVGGFGAGGYIVTAGGKEEPLLPPDAPGGFLTSFGPQMTDFAENVLAGTPFHRCPEYAMGDLLVAKAIYKSAASRQWEPVWSDETAHFKQSF